MTIYINVGKMFSAKQNRGRKLKFTDWDRRALKKIVTQNNKTILPEITSEMCTHLLKPVYTKTIQRELHVTIINGIEAITNPLVSM